MEWIYIPIILLLVFPYRCVSQPPVYSTDLETALRAELFTNYTVLQRPSQKVNVVVSMTLLTINDMNIKDQTLSISGYLTLNWLDTRLSWTNTAVTSQDYTNVNFLFSTEEYVWRPAIIIENSVKDISVISQTEVPMRIVATGRVYWSPSGIYTVSCESDTTYYPMDYQSCTIKVSTWAYTLAEVELFYHLTTPVSLEDYSPNGEWDLFAAKGTETKSKIRSGQSFSSLIFQINLQRRPMFHILNTLFPVFLMAILIPMAFKLPPDSGEKIGYTLTVLLAYAVYLTLISDNIPSTSVTICILSIYLALTLMYGTISVILVIIVLSAHHKPEDTKIPGWLKSLTKKFLMQVACWNEMTCCCKNKKNEVVQIVEVIDNDTKKTKGKVEKPYMPPKDEYEINDEDGLTWQKIALVLDKFFFVVMMTLVLLTTFTVFTIMLGHYINHA